MKLKKVLLFIMAILCSVAMFAQGQWGGVKGTVVNRSGRMPLAQAAISVSQGGETVATVVSDAEGKFILESLPNGVYDMTVKVPGFIDANVNVTVEGYVKDLIFVGMTQDNSSIFSGLRSIFSRWAFRSAARIMPSFLPLAMRLCSAAKVSSLPLTGFLALLIVSPFFIHNGRKLSFLVSHGKTILQIANFDKGIF